MPRDKGVVSALIGLGEAGKPAVLTQCGKIVPASCDYLVRIALMADIKDDAVNARVINPVQRDRQLHRSEVRREMPAGLRNIFYQKLSDLRAKRVKLALAELFYIIR